MSTVSKKPALLDTFDPRRVKEINNLKPHPDTGRLIDAYPGKRTRPMRVLCLGQSRTGTMAQFHALKILGYNPYHMAVAIASPKTNLSLWKEALEAKYHGKGKPWGREEFDKLLGDYDAVADVPAICFVEDLVAAYPEAKVIVTSRTVESWLQSMDNTGGTVLRWWGWPLLARFDGALAGPFWEFAQVVTPINFRTMYDFSPETSPARQAFQDHYELVRKTVPVDKRLEFTVQQGWEPLCQFLGEPVPEEEFPRLNDAKEFVFAHGIMWWLAAGKMLVKLGSVAAVPVAGIILARYLRR